MVSEHSTMADHSTNVTPLQDSGEIPIAGSGLITRQTTSQMTNQSFPSLGQSIEFHPSHFVVKDQKTRLALLQGKIKKGFYKLHATTRAVGDPLTFYSTSSTSNVGSLRLWHNRLGHPSVDVVSKRYNHENLLKSSISKRKYQVPLTETIKAAPQRST